MRIKKEALNDLSENEERDLLSKILVQRIVQTVLFSQKPDGWFGNAFHGQSATQGEGMYDNMEVGLRCLEEKGLSPDIEYIEKAVNSFLTKDPYDAAYGVKAPKPPAMDYTYTAIGLYLPRSSILLRAGYEYRLPSNDFIDLKHDIDYSFNTFINVLNYENLDNVIDTHRKKLCFKAGLRWSCLYDLRMLAHSQGWRNEKNTSLLADSVSRLFSFPQTNEMVYTYIKGQYKGPCFAFIYWQMQALGIIKDDNLEAAWFEIMELLARCGVIKQVALLSNKFDYLLSLIDDDLTIKNINVDKRKSHGWSPYFGIALEEDWKEKIRLQCDLLFRVLLIIHYNDCS